MTLASLRLRCSCEDSWMGFVSYSGGFEWTPYLQKKSYLLPVRIVITTHEGHVILELKTVLQILLSIALKSREKHHHGTRRDVHNRRTAHALLGKTRRAATNLAESSSVTKTNSGKHLEVTNCGNQTRTNNDQNSMLVHLC